MAMMTGDRPVVISVMGASFTSHQMNYTVKVPYSSMARTIQVITKQGGKITNVTVATMAPTVAPSEVPEVPEVPTVLPSAAPTATIVPIKAPIKESNKGFKPKKK
jgi:hypothetical protein